jgi:hypothetical protein
MLRRTSSAWHGAGSGGRITGTAHDPPSSKPINETESRAPLLLKPEENTSIKDRPKLVVKLIPINITDCLFFANTS